MYDRQLLLAGSKRNTELELWEVHRYGTDSFGDPDYVSIYGRRPADWYAQGARLLGRTAVECTRDALGQAIGTDVASIAAMSSATVGAFVMDPFAGSGNTLYWLLRCLPTAQGLGFELDRGVFRLTVQNLAVLGLRIDIRNTDYRSGSSEVAMAAETLLVVFIAPPWGDALDQTSGLDLRRTRPPILEIVDWLFQRFNENRFLFAIQMYETITPESLAEVQARFEWSALHIYGLNAPGQNHGLLLGTKGWRP